MNIKEIVQKEYSEIVIQNNFNAEQQQNNVCLPIFHPIKPIYPTFKGYIDEANLGLGCGFPFEYISFSKNDKILDLGCAAGIDCFIMASKISENGLITGIDLTQSLIDKANAIAKNNNIKNVQFIQGDIEKLPFQKESIDHITSNGVFSLLPNLSLVFDEIFRVLKPNGQFCFSDINKKGKFGPEKYSKVKAFTGCLNGIRYQKLYLDYLKNAGFSSIEIVAERPVILPNELFENQVEQQLFISTFKIIK